MLIQPHTGIDRAEDLAGPYDGRIHFEVEMGSEASASHADDANRLTGSHLCPCRTSRRAICT